jgi:hypothetical protein
MYRVQPTFCLAQKMGAGLGEREVLLGALSRRACSNRSQR